MKFDNMIVLHGLGYLMLMFALYEAWNGEIRDRTGTTLFKKNPVLFSISGGFKLMLAFLLCLASPELSKVDQVQAILGLAGIVVCSSLVIAVVAWVSTGIRDAHLASCTPREREKTVSQMGPSTFKVLALCCLWVLLAGVVPFLYSTLGEAQLNGHYVKTVAGIVICAGLWIYMGVTLFMPYSASIESSKLLIRSLLGTQEIPLSQITYIENGIFSVCFTTRERTYKVTKCIDESSSSRERTRAFVKKVSAVSGAPHKVGLELA